MHNNNPYTDKEVLHDALTSQKTITGMFNTSSNECVHPELRKVMLDILSDEHAIQFEVFNDMHQRGMYPTPSAQEDKVTQMKDQYCQQSQTNTGVWHTDREEKKEPRM